MGKSEKKKNIVEPTSNVHNSTYIFNIQSAIKKNPRDVNCLSSTLFFITEKYNDTMLCSLKAKYPEEEMHTVVMMGNAYIEFC